jgi:hypothetical protein
LPSAAAEHVSATTTRTQPTCSRQLAVRTTAL